MYLFFLFQTMMLQAAALSQEKSLMSIVETELIRSFEELSPKDVYWIGLGISDVHTVKIQANNGALFTSRKGHYRNADIDLRIGTPQLDNTHPLRDAGWLNEPTHFYTSLPLENSPKPIQIALWKEMDEAFQSSKRRLVKIQANNIVKVDMEDQSDDFKLLDEDISPNTHSTPIKKFEVDEVFWKEKLRSSSAALLSYPYAVDSGVTLSAYDEVDYILDTEGTRIQHQRQHFRLSTYIQVIADDGMNLEVYDYMDSNSENQLRELDIEKMVLNVIKKAEDLRNAPVIDPFVGPAILRGRASAVFFHEILGHRVEADRQKRDEDGKTLTDKIDQPIFPSFISVIDDPTLSKWQEQSLNGHYLYDDEGSKAQKVTVIENGILKNFLTSRSPTKHFEESNGHGRREEGNAPVSRQGNLIVQTPSTKSFADLKEDLLQEIQKGNHDYGLIFDDISGGFTFTGRVTPNSYNVRPVTVWRVYPDGREELVRGVDLIGTPLLTFQRIIDSSNEIDVFNGQCGAESGWVPVSAIAPDLLISEVEVQRKEKGSDRPPILPVPDHQ